MSEKLENKNKRGRLTWASSLCSPAAAGRPSQQAAQPASSSVVFVLDRGRGACPARARATAPRHQLACLPAPPLLVWMAWNNATPSPVLSHSPPVLPLLFLALSLPCPNAPIAAVRHSRRHRPPLASPTRAGAPPPRPEALRQATRRRTPCGAAVAIVFLLGLRPPSPSIRRLQCVPEPASTPAATAVSSATVPLSSPPRSRAVAPFPTTAGASRRRPCRRRRLGPPPPKPSTLACSRCHEGAAEPLRWPPRAPQPVPARSRAPAAAASFAPASSGLPRSFHLPHQMRESPGYAPVLSDAAPVACFADAAASRGRRRRPRRSDEWAPSAGD